MEPKIRRINLLRKTATCPTCKTDSKRHSVGKRRLRELGISSPMIIEVIYSKHFCPQCRKHFNLSMDHIAQPNGRFTNRVRRTAVDLVVNKSFTLKKASEYMRQTYCIQIPYTTIHDWVVAKMTRRTLNEDKKWFCE